jgi:hypothetical protein
MKRRLAEVDASIDRYLQQLAAADQAEPAEDKILTPRNHVQVRRIANTHQILS